MLIRLLLGVVLVLGVTGCATTHTKQGQDQLQTRVVELEKKLEEKDAEIVDLQYEVKDLHSKVETNASSAEDVSASSYAEPVVISKSSDDVIKVNVSAQKVQTALKNAGFYTGKIDGKIGAGTKAAIVAFQKSQGLTADGKVGPKTWDALKSYAK